MLKKVLLAIVFLGAQLSYADEFKSAQVVTETAKCKLEKDALIIEGVTAPYKLYDKNSKRRQVLECKRIQIEKQLFYTFQFTSLEEQGVGASKLWIFEIASQDPATKSLRTVRSEIVDRIRLNSDLPGSGFENSFKSEWGVSTKDSNVMLKIDISSKDKTESPYSYLIKLNSKKNWFENVF